MPEPPDSKKTGGRLTGADMNKYFESFADRLLQGRIRFNAEIKNVARADGGGWSVLIKDMTTGTEEIMHYQKIVVCTGVRGFIYVRLDRNANSCFRDVVNLLFPPSCLPACIYFKVQCATHPTSSRILQIF